MMTMVVVSGKGPAPDSASAGLVVARCTVGSGGAFSIIAQLSLDFVDKRLYALAIVYLLPMSVLGVLLVFAGGQLALTVMDVMNRKDLFVVLLMLAITLATNLAAGFLIGISLAYAFRSEKLSV
jgi:hypothetical protein